MKKIKYIIIFLLMGCNGPQPVEELPLIKEFEGKENYRIWTTKKQFDGQGLMYAESKYFIAYDTLNRVINKNNSTFYYYDSANKIIEEKSIFRRDRIVKVMTKTYEYNKDGSLELILRIGESIDTIQKIIYDDNNRIIASNSRHKKVTFEYHQDRLRACWEILS